jgi:hypothetical protein
MGLIVHLYVKTIVLSFTFIPLYASVAHRFGGWPTFLKSTYVNANAAVKIQFLQRN